MDFKIIRTLVYENYKYPGVLSVNKCDPFGNLRKYSYHIHILSWVYRDTNKQPKYICTNRNSDENDYEESIISKVAYTYCNNVCGNWGVIASTLPSLDLPSIDESIVNLVKDTPTFDISGVYTCNLCPSHLAKESEYFHHLYGDITLHEWYEREHHKATRFAQNPCTFFTVVDPYKNANKDVKFFYKNDKLFILRRYNGKIYEGLQWLNLSEEEKETMLNE